MFWDIQISSRFGHIQNPGTVSEAMSYSGIFKTRDIFSRFQARYVIQGLLKSNLGMFWTIFRKIQAYLELWLI